MKSLLLACLAALICLHPKCISADTILPKPGPLSRVLTVCEANNLPIDETLYYVSLQGIINQVKPRVYLILDTVNDPVWLEWLQKRKHIDSIQRIDRRDLLSRYRSDVNGAVIYDPELPTTVNIATMVAAINRFAILSPELAKRTSLPIKSDLRGRFKDNSEAYAWAIDNLMPYLNKTVMCSLMPWAAAGWPRDYLIQQKVFTFWVSSPDDVSKAGHSDRERGVIERAFRLTLPSAPVTGFWSYGVDYPGINEYGGLVWAGGFGKPTIGHDWTTNNSIQAAVRVDPRVFRQRIRKPTPLRKDKVYVAVSIIDSGDAPWYWERVQPKVWADPNRGKVPISWALGPGTLDVLPGVLEWYYANATDNDYFFCGVSGAAYMIPSYFANKSAHSNVAWDRFLSLTRDYMRKLDLDTICLHMDIWGMPVQYQDSAIFKLYADNIPGLRSILSDFGRMDNLDSKRAIHRTNKNVTVFHCLNRWIHTGIPNPTDYLVNDIRTNTPVERPAFLHLMALSWSFTPSDILKAKEIVGDDYVFVTVGEMDQLYRASRISSGHSSD